MTLRYTLLNIVEEKRPLDLSMYDVSNAMEGLKTREHQTPEKVASIKYKLKHFETIQLTEYNMMSLMSEGKGENYGDTTN